MIKIYFDGGAKPNPGHGYGSWQIERDGNPNLKGSWSGLDYEQHTNNEAEYLTLIKALERALCHYIHDMAPVMIYSDSILVVRQVTGEWKVKHKKMKPLHVRVMDLLSRIENWHINWNPRSVNVEKFGH